MSYLNQKHNTQLIFYRTYLKIDMGQFPQHSWTKFNRNVEEAISVYISKPLGKEVDIHVMCDSDHAGNK